MVELLSHKTERFLAEMSEEARAYFLPGIDNEPLYDLERGELPVSSCAPCETLYETLQETHSSVIDEPYASKHHSAPRRRMPKVGSGKLISLIIPKQKEFDVEPPVADLELDERTKAIMKEFDALMKKHGLSVEEVEIMLAYRVKLSRLRITGKKEILLEDFDRKEVRMDTLTKAVFFLYLRHPEGIRYKDLSDYQQELEEIYSSITGREDLDRIRKSVADLCDPLNNSINEMVSKVKKAFRDAVNDRVARFYYIDGEKGTAKRIALDRDYVLWE